MTGADHDRCPEQRFSLVKRFGSVQVLSEQLFGFALPEDTFVHSVPGMVVVLEVRQLAVVVIAHDQNGDEASTPLLLVFRN